MTTLNSRRCVQAAVVSFALVLSLSTVGRALSETDTQQLERDRILITDLAFKQIFEAYKITGMPFFVTSDSLLNAYHVLYEESILRLEQANAQKLPDVLRFILGRLDATAAGIGEQGELTAAAKRRATIVVGVALKLLDDGFRITDSDMMAIIDEEVARIVEAQMVMKPAWLGPPEPDFMYLDYSRYKVRGFYTESERLTRYFRAVAWLQSIPFRVSHDDELLSILMLGACIGPDGSEADDARYQAHRTFFRTYTEFLGLGDDWDLVTASDAVTEGLDFDLEAKRTELIAQAADAPQINDQWRYAPADPNIVAEPNFRIISAYRLPEAVLFQRTTDIRQFPARSFPSGLEVCIALGSTFARDRLDSVQKADVLATIDENLGLFDAGTSLYFDYLRMIATLLDAPEPNAPDFMTAEPWQAKSCGTALAGWAQLRHTWVLQAKLNVIAFSTGRIPAGFVEPEPEFFRRMADLAARTRALLNAAGALDHSWFSVIDALRDLADLLDQSVTEEEFWQMISQLPDEDSLRLGHLSYLLDWPDSDDLPEEEWTAAMAGLLRRMADDLGEGIVDPLLAGIIWMYDSDITSLWSLLEEVSLRLESIARKQLAGSGLDAAGDAFIASYGDRLAKIMGYDGNYSSEHPKDDAPRIADVYSNPEVGGNLHVGVGRARAIYVLYPWQGQSVLCRGAVMPYYEFVDSGRLTDEEWKARLDSDARPDVPAWLRPIVSETGLSAPDFIASNGR
ncbi:MAG TPA: DUF3160 domain-containing protein [Sedimentisphaerales bacterium]|nr:DUF3160 domain-containing protein [Sedimentisphaerales bacterium]HRS11670.1 DUF3160 domain-containing protein [Sedimentisphaerales bacterium]HRV48333.1 DUF3160 domain-containing protein [Sedimentisphaerales bacterium]